jgi:hypothetical protein
LPRRVLQKSQQIKEYKKYYFLKILIALALKRGLNYKKVWQRGKWHTSDDIKNADLCGNKNLMPPNSFNIVLFNSMSWAWFPYYLKPANV